MEKIDFDDFEWEEESEKDYKLITIGGSSNGIFIMVDVISDTEITLYDSYIWRAYIKNFWKELKKEEFYKYIKTNHLPINVYSKNGVEKYRWSSLPSEIKERIKLYD